MSVQSLAKKLFETRDGSVVSKTLNKLAKEAVKNRPEVLSILFDYMKNGQLDHWRSFVVPQIIDIVEERELNYSSYFEDGLTDSETAYWCVSGLIKTSGPNSYGVLCEFAENESNELEARSNAIRCLALDSDQTFISGLPSDPGHWKAEYLPLEKLKEWSSAGFPKGKGFEPPSQHPSLASPETEIEKLAVRFEDKLCKLRSQSQDLSNPSNWLVPATPSDIKAIKSKWNLPSFYLEFLEKFSPLNVNIKGINIYGAGYLIDGQLGYSFNPVKNEMIEDWPKDYVVIADRNADPYVIDLRNVKNGDAPILTARHGEGKWVFDKYAAKFTTLISKLSK